MINEVKSGLVESAQPVMEWLTQNGGAVATRVLAASVIFIIGVLVIKMFTKFLQRIVDKWSSDKALLGRFLVSVAVKSGWLLLFIVVIAKLGVEVGPLIAGLGATGFILGFACQESLSSLAAGIMIAFNQPFKIGDFVTVAGYEGVIRHLDMMAVVLTTGDNRQITIPNKQAWGSAIVNYSAMELRRIEVAVGIAYSADIGKACEVGLATVAAIPEVLKDPAPAALVKSLDDSAVSLLFRAWVKNADYWPVSSAATRQIKESYDRAGIAIPFPQLDVHVSPAHSDCKSQDR